MTDVTPAPPPMPTAATGKTADKAAPSAGWAVDPTELRSFGDAVVRARSFLDSVQMKIDRMQGAELTPQLGTSPVGQQLAKKFDDRLNATHGLRAMLAEAMRRMDTFVASAEQAAKSYAEMDATGREAYQRFVPGGIDRYDG
jgi:hypothetical protein